MVRGGSSPEEAASHVGELLPRACADAALVEFLKRAGIVRELKDPPGLDGSLARSWYTGPAPEDRYWPALRQVLLGRLDGSDVGSIDNASTKVVARLPCPGDDGFSGRGLVLGYVQSGKTANFSAVITKAADAGYRLIVVMSGVTNSLRRQTQRRLSEEILDLNPDKWIALTSEDEDFRRGGRIAAANAMLTSGKPVLCVVKKNGVVLRRLLKWLQAASPETLRACPTLIVDDEADQASVNTAKGDAIRAVINDRVVSLLRLMPRVAYVGYTATPFANIFVDITQPEDLYPRDFIIDLPRPPAYFGPERIFGRDRMTQDEADEAVDGLDMIRRVPDDDVAVVAPRGRDRSEFMPQIAPSLAEALDYFMLASAVRVVRGQGDKHCSMLIHTTLYANIHARFKPVVEQWLASRLAGLAGHDPATEQHFADLWAGEASRVPSASMGEVDVTYDAISAVLQDTIRGTVVVVENSTSDERLDYEKEPQRVIVIGGNVLARGLTIEGLVVSYFVRAASTYDTLLQMGRWFGYRGGYSDLPRIWMTEDLDNDFRALALVERELRADIRRYEHEGITPLQFSPKIRTHPSLMITSQMKMQHAVDCEVSYSGRSVQTILFEHRDPDVVDRNQRAVRTLLERVPSSAWERSGGHTVTRSVDVAHVLSLISSYQFHENNVETSPSLLTGYIKAQMGSGSLLRWNIGVVSRDKDGTAFDVGLPWDVHLLQRSRLEREDDTYANLGVITSEADLVCDLPGTMAKLTSDDPQVGPARDLTGPLLLIYPIDMASKPARATSGRRPRKALDAIGHLFGLAFVFPDSRVETALGYKTVDRSGLPREEPELPDEPEDE